MASNQEWLDAFRRYSMRNYDPAPVAFVRGKNAEVWDAEGKRYLDLAAGVAVNALGHAHARWVEAVAQQAAQIAHTSNLYLVPKQLELAQRLVSLSGLDRAFFCNSGTEALEAAFKLARYWGQKHGGRTEFVATHKAFHGRTMGALSLTGQPHYHKGFEPLVPGVTHVAFGDPQAIEDALTPRTAAVVLEPVQGEGGVNVPPAEYLKRVRQICDKHGVLLILDEVQTGVGRLGSWFGFQTSKARPDILALAKGLGGGFPIGAVLATEAASAFEPGAHGSTFGGNPLACAAALATLSIIEAEGVLANVATQSQAIMSRLEAWRRQGLVLHPRGQGLLIGFDLPQGGSKAFSRRLLQAGLLVSNIGEKTIRLAPPLTIGTKDVEEALSILGPALEEARTAPAALA